MQLVMDNSVLKIADMHKHLRITVLSNTKWKKQAESIYNQRPNTFHIFGNLNIDSREKYYVKCTVCISVHCWNTLVKYGMVKRIKTV